MSRRPWFVVAATLLALLTPADALAHTTSASGPRTETTVAQATTTAPAPAPAPVAADSKSGGYSWWVLLLAIPTLAWLTLRRRPTVS